MFPRQICLALAMVVAGCDSEAVIGDGGSGVDVGGDVGLDAGGPDQAAPDQLKPLDFAQPDLGPSGKLMMLTYNIAGLPWGLSKSDPLKNTPLISPLLNHFELVLLQEDFAFTQNLASKANHPYKSTPGTPQGTVVNDGLTLFSNFPFKNLKRHKWTQCFGIFDHANDCLASKGFSVAELELAPGVWVDVYNLHMDAGSDTQDYSARVAQVLQLLAEIAVRSKGRAVIVAGDTNLKFGKKVDNEGLLEQLLKQGGLTDACRALQCGDERIDRVMYRNSAALELQALSWKIDPRFVDGDGKPLSDHEPVAVELGWTVKGGGGDGGAPDSAVVDLAVFDLAVPDGGSLDVVLPDGG